MMEGRQHYSYKTVGDGSSLLHCLTTAIITFNVLFAILGALMVSLGIWITQDNNFKDWVQDLNMQHFWVGVYILMAAGGLVMLQAFFGICGAFQRISWMLKAFCACLVVCLCLELGGGAYMLSNGIRDSKIESWLQRRFYDLIDVFDTDQKSARIMNIIQEWVGCCGVTGWLDYVRWNKVIPNTCYNPITGNAWYTQGYGYVGCVRGFTGFLERRAGLISGVALFLAAFQIITIVCTCCLIREAKEQRRRNEY